MKNHKTIEELTDFAGEAIYSIRWILLPMYLGLWFAMVAYTAHFFSEIYEFVYTAPEFVTLTLKATMTIAALILTTVSVSSLYFKQFPQIIKNISMGFAFLVIGMHFAAFFPFSSEHTSNEYLIFSIELVDMTMIANLIVMTTIGGYSTFVNEFSPSKLKNKPRWMNKLDSSTLKIKMSMSLVAVTAVHLLKTFVILDDHSNLILVGTQIVIHLVFLGSMLIFSWNAKLLHGHEPAPSFNEPTQKTKLMETSHEDHH